ncbi:C40 family peptidase [Mobilitalea sibirica]|uniref:C40 family peptidase n=1 Tax=Mobilitalea sibirica TaxID=1462919 RepID=A0A8J7H2A5_9FIRM|nr:C40 family peptidase [Mobilitalea sibirica]MBH1940859.1 C40 family peptidase [Mobilitalea sibirica]
MERKLLKFSLVFATGAIILAANPKSAMAYEEAVAGYTFDKQNIQVTSDKDSSAIATLSTDEIPIPGFTNIGIAMVDTNLLIREKPEQNGKIIGKLPRHGGITVVEEDNGDGWTKVSFGKLTGYVKSQYLLTGPEASKMAVEVGNYIATANTNGLRVRKEPSIDSEILDQIAKGEELLVLDALVVTYGEEHNKWVKVSLDSEDSEDGKEAYVAKEFVDLSYALAKPMSLEELQYGTGVSSTRVNLVNLAKEYLGYRYVWGGNTLGKGVDCSGFTQQIYKRFGYYIPRVSRDQARGGTRISSSSIKPGDLVFYGNNSSGYIDHVGIYIGNSKIIHASNKRDGIKISNMYYRQPVKIVRYIND